VRSQPAGGDRFGDRGHGGGDRFDRSYDRGFGGDRRGGYGSSSHGGSFGGRGGGGGRFPRDPNPFEEKEFLERVEQGINLYVIQSTSQCIYGFVF
jgi:hypothetical protein